MDIRITNICDNDCLYCLEQSYRKKRSFVEKEEVFRVFADKNNDGIVNFYGGNPLLHPDLEEIIAFCKKNGSISVGILTNTHSLDVNQLQALTKAGLTSIGFYFNSFDKNRHRLITNGGIDLDELLRNMETIRDSGISSKAIIHINQQNIESVYQDVYVLFRKYGVRDMEFINYFPFDRPYDRFREFLHYDIEGNRENIDRLFAIISKTKVHANFVKFPKIFFGRYEKWYDFNRGILSQIGDEDRERIESDGKWSCRTEGKCKECFIQDNCGYPWKDTTI